MVTETQVLEQGFWLEKPELELSGRQTTLNLGCLTGNQEIAGKIISKYLGRNSQRKPNFQS